LSAIEHWPQLDLRPIRRDTCLDGPLKTKDKIAPPGS
jgi:hypothetical protein